MALTVAVLVAVSLVFPLAIQLAGRSSTGQNYLTWQLTRSSNHAETFYLTAIPAAIGWAVIVAAAGCIVLPGQSDLARVAAGVVDRRSLCDLRDLPPQGLPVPVADRPGPGLLRPAAWRPGTCQHAGTCPPVGTSSPPPSPDQPWPPSCWHRCSPGCGPWCSRPTAPRRWPDKAGSPEVARPGSGSGCNLVPGTELMTIGPSMANILEYYGHRPAQGSR